MIHSNRARSGGGLVVLAAVCLSLSACGLRVSHAAVLAANGANGHTTVIAVPSGAPGVGAPSSGAAETLAVGPTQPGATFASSAASGLPGVGAASQSIAMPGSAASRGGTAGAGSGGIPGDIITAKCNGTTSGTIKIGNVFPYSATGAGPTFAASRQLIDVWSNYVNAHGGICGRKVQILSDDDGGSASVTASDYTNLVQNEHVVAFVFGGTTLTLGSYEPYVESHHIAIIGGDLETGVFNRSPVFFPQGASVTEQDYGLYKAVQGQPNGRKVALLYCVEVTACTETYNFQTKQHIPEAVGSQIVYSKAVSLTQISFAAECQAAKKAGAGAILSAGDASFLERIANSCGQQGITMAYMAPYIVVSDSLLQNQYLNNHTFTDTQTQPWLATNTPASALFAQLCAEYGVPRTGAGMLAWSALLLMQQALTALGTGPITSATVLSSLQHNIKDYTIGGLVGPTTFHAGAQTQGQCQGEAEIRNGKWVLQNNGSLTCRNGTPGPLPNP